MTGPVVTLFGASGYLGKWVAGPFIEALKEGKLQELRLPTRRLDDKIIQGFVARGAKAFKVDFNDRASLDAVLKGTHTVISLLGTGTGSPEINEKLVDAMVGAGIKRFLPSEFGTNHYKIKEEYNHPVFNSKKIVFQNAKAKGLNPIRILCCDILEASFGKWFGLDCGAEVWSIVGDGNVQVAMTSEKDVGRFALEVVLLAFNQPDKEMPDEYEVHSVQATLREYAQIFDKVAGRPTKLEFVTLEAAKEEYKKSINFEYIIRILFAEGAYDYTNAIGNSLLNPEGKVWKLRTIDEYAKETGGRPWRNFK